jgi:uncharacterized integral membrane protein (TIGR00697 family)
MKVWSKGKWLWMRTIGSTLVGEGVDTIFFITIAFANTLPWTLFWSIILSNYVFKCGLEAIMTPITYQVINFLKRAEQEDVYDTNTDFNPFKIDG